MRNPTTPSLRWILLGRRTHTRRGALLFPLVVLAASEGRGQEVVNLEPIEVTAPAEVSESTESSLGTAGTLKSDDLASRRGITADAGRLLLEIPGTGMNAAGGIASLPSIHGMSDDRLRITVDGAEVVSACPNHMNAPLSYVTPSRVKTIKVFGAVAPVSAGGDSIGGAIQVELAALEFATVAQKIVAHAEAGSFLQSNGLGVGFDVSASAATPWLSLSYAESRARANNYKAGGDFKPVSPGSEGGRLLAGNEVGSSAYHGATNRSLGLALRRNGNLVRLDVSHQTVDFEGFPNQRMDMTANENWMVGGRYTGQFGWGDLVARLSYQDTRHQMDMGGDRYSYGTGMPMESRAKNRVASVQGNIFLGERGLLRTGVEYQAYTLFDWWPAVGGAMGPNDFWNIDLGRRRKLDLFAEWEGQLKDGLVAQVGVRGGRVGTDAAAVQGYDNGLANAWGNDAASFNNQARRRYDYNWDLTGLVDYAPGPRQSYQAGYSRRSRSPNLYQRYAWSTNAMAALMNNFMGDGNGYLGNLGLLPEVTNALSVTGHWHDADNARWDVKATAHYNHVQDFIDARRCTFGQCSGANAVSTAGFVLLQYANQTAQLYGGDLSGRLVLVDHKRVGSVEAGGMASYSRGKNLTTGDNLYGIMPLHGRFWLGYRFGPFRVAPELMGVAAKEQVSRVRNEMPTDAFWLINVRASLAWTHFRLDFAVENLLDRLYANPLGGAYLGQGASMTTQGVPWGVVVPGRGRSINAALRISY